MDKAELLTYANARISYLKDLVSVLEKRIDKAPEGKIKISHIRGKTCYYLIVEGKERQYINKKELNTAKRLVQKGYEQSTLKAAKFELIYLQKFVDKYPQKSPEDIYNSLSEARKELVHTVFKTIDDYINEWQNTPYTPKPFSDDAPYFETNRGERVRSKSEQIIANRFYERGVPYKYECPLRLEGFGKIYPDFTVLNLKTQREEYIEHNGMMDDIKYVENYIKRTNAYQLNGIMVGDRLHLIFETRQVPLDTRILDLLIDRLLDEYRSKELSVHSFDFVYLGCFFV